MSSNTNQPDLPKAIAMRGVTYKWQRPELPSDQFSGYGKIATFCFVVATFLSLGGIITTAEKVPEAFWVWTSAVWFLSIGLICRVISSVATEVRLSAFERAIRNGDAVPNMKNR